MQAIYVYAVILSFGLGIAWQDIFRQGTPFAVFLLILSVALILVSIKAKTAKPDIAATPKQGLVVKHLTVLVIGIFAFTLGAVRMQMTQESSDISLQSLAQYQGQHIGFEGVVADEPDKRENNTNLVIRLLSIGGEDNLGAGSLKILVRASTHKDFTYGDKVHASGKLERVQNFSSDTDGGREFDYRGYLGKDDIYYIINRADVSVSGQVEQHWLDIQYWLFNIKQEYVAAIEQSIPEPESALAGGITVGSKNSLGKELLEKFRKTGVIHIVVLSGFNVTIIAIFLTYIFAFAGPRIGRGLSAVGIILFALLTGGGATVVRASAMGLLALLALTVGRTYAVLRALFIVGFVMLLINPKILLSDISFQLSFIATLGMILGMPIIQRKLGFITTKFKLQEIVAATIATQIAVSPLLLYYMGELSIVALPANVLVLPLVSFAMLATFFTGFIGMFASVLATPFAYAAYALLSLIVSVVELLAKTPFATIGSHQFSIWWVVITYALIGVLVAIFKSSSDELPVYIR